MANNIVTIKFDLGTGVATLKGATKASKDLHNQTQMTAQAISSQDRATKSVAGNTKNSTAAFAKQAQGLGGLVHIYATVAANVWALTAAFQVLKNAADVSIMAEAARDLSISTGLAFDQVAKSMQRLTGGAIGFTEAMRQANLALAGGATISQVEQITVIANKAANALGVSVPGAVGRMIQAVTKGEPELVDELGIILRVTKATEDYAGTLGKTANELSTLERQQAIINQLIEQGTAKFGDAAQRTNPFEKLAASTTDLARSILTLTSDVLGPAITVIADNAALVAVGFGLIAHQILKLILPSIRDMRAEFAKAANTEAAKLAETIDQIGEAQKRAAAAEKRLTRVRQNANMASGRTGPSAFIKDMLDDENILAPLNKSRGLPRVFKKALEDALAQGADEAEVTKILKDSKIVARMKRAVDSDAPGTFKKGTTDVQKAVIREQIEALKDLIRIEEREKELQKQIDENLKRESIAIREKYTTRINATYQQVKLNIAENQKFFSTKKVLKAALQELNDAYAKHTYQLSAAQKAQFLFQRTAQRASLVVSAGVNAVSLAFTKLFGWVASITIAVAVIKDALQFLGVLNKEFLGNSDAAREAAESVEKMKEDYADLNQQLNTVPGNIDELSNAWNRAAGVADQYLQQLEAITNQSQVLTATGLFDQLVTFGAVGKERTAAAEGILGIIEGVEKLTNKPFAVEFEVDKNTQLREQITKEIVGTGQALRAAMQAPEMLRDEREIQVLEKRLKSLAAQMSKLSREALVVSIDKDTSVEELERIFDNPEAIQNFSKVSKQAFLDAVEPVKTVATAAKEAQGIIGDLDKKLTDLRNKSESRRSLGVDTLIDFRDGFLRLNTKLTKILEKGTDEAKESFRKVLTEDVSKDLLNAFFPNIDLTTSPKFIVNQITTALTSLDAQIDTIRHAKDEIAQLAEVEKRARIERDRGDLSAIADLYQAGTDKIGEQIKAINAQMVVVLANSEIVEKDKNARIVELETLKEQLKTKEKELSTRKGILPILTREAEESKRILDINEAIASLVDQRFQFSTELANTTREISNNTVAVLNSLRQQVRLFNLSKEASDRKLESQIKEKEAALALLKAEKDKRLFIDKELEIQELKERRRAKELEDLKTARDLRLQIIEAENRARGDAGTGIFNSFGKLFEGGFSEAFKQGMAQSADEMARAMVNPIQQMVNLFNTATSAATGTLVDALLTREWDGKEEGRSMGVAIREAIKADLRDAIGEAIKANMQQAIATMFGRQDAQIVAIDAEIVALQLNTDAIVGNTTAILSSDPSSNASALSAAIPLVSGTGGGSIIDHSLISPFAKGGIVTGPTPALVGEGGSAEAIVPLPDNRSIPVKLEGSGSSNVNINQSFDFRGADSGTEARLRQYAKRIKEETIKDITENINRGGSLAKVVGRRR